MTAIDPSVAKSADSLVGDLDTMPPDASTQDCRIPEGALEPPAIHWLAADRAAFLEAVFANTTDVVFIFDRAARLLDVNAAACALANANRPGELCGQYVDRWIAEEQRKSFHEALKTLAQGRHAELRIDFVTRSGERRYLNARLLPLRCADGEAIFVAVCRDLTDALQWESIVRQKQKLEMVGRVAGEVVHDFNNLLTVINGFSEIALQSVGPDNPLCQMLRDIHHAGDKAAQISRQFLAFSRRQSSEVRTVDLRTVLSDMDKILRRVLGHEIDLLVSTEPGASAIRADAGQIEQALLNLAVNARDAMPQGGRLTIALRPVPAYEVPVECHNGTVDGPYVLLAVTDTGCGMEAATQNRIFEPFFTTKGPGQGTGLGLATVAKVVEQHAGFIEVISEVGRGTTFNMYFPSAEM
jgi:PAS domain S-box-containing protein